MRRSCHGSCGTGSGMHSPIFFSLTFDGWHVRHLETFLATSFFKPGQ